jgi:hypothetical protein
MHVCFKIVGVHLIESFLMHLASFCLSFFGLSSQDMLSLKHAISFSARHNGELLCVSSTINGGGKSHAIQSMVGERQRLERDMGLTKADQIKYRRLPFRESSTAHSLVCACVRVILIGYVSV